MTDQMTNTEPARPDLEGIDELIYAYAATSSPMPPGSVIYYLAQLADYVRRLEATNTRLNRRAQKMEKRLNRWGASREYSFSLWWDFVGTSGLKNAVVRLARQNGIIAELRDSNAALLAAGIEETARADSEKQRADSAEQNNRILNAIVFPACGTGGITASLAPQLTVQAICAPIAANLSPETPAEAEKSTTAFGREYWEGRGK